MRIIKHMKHTLRRFKDRWLWRLYPKKTEAKIFVVGYNKTGTTSVGKALQKLGYRHSSFNEFVWRELYNKGNIDGVINYTKRFESFDDLPWLKEDLLPILFETFPNSRYIYLQRDEASWKRSYKDWNKYHHNNDVDENKAWEAYCQHKKFISEFFKVKVPNQNSITLEVKDPKGFEKLAGFLGREVPQPNFPRENVTERPIR